RPVPCCLALARWTTGHVGRDRPPLKVNAKGGRKRARNLLMRSIFLPPAAVEVAGMSARRTSYGTITRRSGLRAMMFLVRVSQPLARRLRGRQERNAYGARRAAGA